MASGLARTVGLGRAGGLGRTQPLMLHHADCQQSDNN